ncbi:SRPBCC domain-containing protein [Arthrobacter monumenti]
MPLIAVTSDDDTLVLSWRVACELDKTWAAITDPGLAAQWLGTVIDGDLGTADHVVIDHGDGYLCRSTLIHRDPPQTVEFTWDFPDEPASVVRISLEAEEGATRLHLVHRGLGELVPSYRVGWCVHLTYLEAAALGEPLPPAMFWNLHDTLAKL